MKQIMRVITAALLASVSVVGVATAESSDSSARLCAITNTLTCDNTTCIRGPADSVNLPVFVKVDTKTMTVETARAGGERRSSDILSTSTVDSTQVFVGGELGRVWGAVVDEATGAFTASVAENGTGYIIFGSCLPLMN
jgi:hypothetical protein